MSRVQIRGAERRFSGENIRSHFFGDQLNRPPVATHSGRVVVDYRLPGDGYYSQHFYSMSHVYLAYLVNIYRWKMKKNNSLPRPITK